MSITYCLRSYCPPQREYSASSILSDMSVRFSNSGFAGCLFWEKTTFCNIVHVTYHTRAVDRHILLNCITRQSSMPTRKRWWRSDSLDLVSSLSVISKSLYVKFSLRGLSTPGGPRFPFHPPFLWGLIIFSSHHVPCSCFTIWLENVSWLRNQL